MEQNSRWGLFRKRNVLGAVLAAGLVAGMYLGDYFKGIGGGSSLGIGKTVPEKTSSKSTISTTKQVVDTKGVDIVATKEKSVPNVIKVVIDSRSYLLRTDDGDEPIELSQIVEMVKQAKGDEDGIRLRIYRKRTSRPTAEKALEEAIKKGGISDSKVVFMPMAE